MVIVSRCGDDNAAVKPLEKLAATSARPVTRLQALWTLHDLGRLSVAQARKALRSPTAEIRSAAVRMSEDFFSRPERNAGAHPDLVSDLLRLVDDSSQRVRYQLAFTLGELSDARAGKALASLAIKDGGYDQMRIAVLSSATPHAEGMLQKLIEGIRGDWYINLTDPDAKAMLQELLEGRRIPPSQVVEQLLAMIIDKPDSLSRDLDLIADSREGRFAPWQFDAVGGLLDALDRRDKSLEEFAAQADWHLLSALQKLAPLFAAAREQAGARGGNLSAIRLLGRGKTSLQDDRARLGGLLRSQFPPEVQHAALTALGRAKRDKADVGRILIAGWKGYTPSLRLEVANMLMSRADWIQSLLDAIERGELPASQISTSHRQRLLSHANESIQQRAGRIFGATNSDRAKVVKSYDLVNDLAGDPARGILVYRQICSVCHRLRGEGNEVGPDLGTVADKSVSQILEAIFDPNRAVESRYIGYTVLTKTDREVSGVITAETPNSVTFKQPGGTESTILRSDIKEMTGSGLSLMPEGLESVLKPQDAADVIACIKAGAIPPK